MLSPNSGSAVGLQLEKLLEPAATLVVREDHIATTDHLDLDTSPLQGAPQQLTATHTLDLFIRTIHQADEGHTRALGQQRPIAKQPAFQFLKLLR